MRKRQRKAFTLVEMLVVVAIIGILMAITLPTLHWAREAARRASCKNNLRQLALSVHSFETKHGHLPPYFGVFPAKLEHEKPSWHGHEPRAMFGSWLVHTLPHMGHQALWTEIKEDINQRGSNWDSFTIVRRDKEWVDPNYGLQGSGLGSTEVSETDHFSETTTEEIHHDAQYVTTKELIDVTEETIRIGWSGRDWVGQNDGSKFITVKNYHWEKNTEKVADAYTTLEDVTRYWSETTVFNEGQDATTFGDSGNEGYWKVEQKVNHYEAGGIMHHSDFSMEILQCPSDPTNNADGLNIQYEENYYPSFRPDLEDIMGYITYGRWGVTSYLANWHCFTNGDPDQAPFNPPMPLAGIKDGTSHTIMFGEGYTHCDQIPRLAFYNSAFFDCFGINFYLEPNTYMYQAAPPEDRCNAGRAQTGHLSMNVCMADGSVHSVSSDITHGDRTPSRELAGFVNNVNQEPRRIAYRDELNWNSETEQWTPGRIRNSWDVEQLGPPLWPHEYKAWDKLMLPTDSQSLDDTEQYFF